MNKFEKLLEKLKEHISDEIWEQGKNISELIHQIWEYPDDQTLFDRCQDNIAYCERLVEAYNDLLKKIEELKKEEEESSE